MATQSRRSTASTSFSQSETPSRSPGRRARSPSPARTTRIQEKEQLQNLNDRLAAYIDRVRYLEQENSRLNVQVRTTQETVTREVDNVKSLYDSELSEARKLLDETAKEKAKLQLNANKYKTEADDWQAKFHKRDRDAKLAEKKRLEAQSELGDMEAKLKDAENSRLSAEGEAARLQGEVNNLNHQLAALKKQLEEETLLRVDTENRVQSLKEELAFKSNLHEREMNETRTRVTTTYDESDAVDAADYESKLADALQAMRQEQEEQLRLVREEVEDLYERKVNDLQGALDRSMNVGTSSREEYLITKRKMDEYSSEVQKLKAQNVLLEARVKDLENQLDHESDMHEQQMRQKDAEIHELRQLLNENVQEYADLLDIKLKLDNEIEAYRKLLEGEETRLNLSGSSPMMSTPATTERGRKRKRVTLDEEVTTMDDQYKVESGSTGAVQIMETDEEGRFIKLHNMSDEDVVIGGWTLKHTAGAEEKVYKFTRGLILKANQDVTVWSAKTKQKHKSPTDLVMKNSDWPLANEMKTVLIKDDEEMAHRSMTKSVTRSLRYSRLRDGDPDAAARDSQCSVM